VGVEAGVSNSAVEIGEVEGMNDVFASLEWNPDLNWWSGYAEIVPGHGIDLHVQAAHDPAALRVAVEWATTAWRRLQSDEPSVRRAVAAQMIEAHNDHCNPEDEVTSEQFAARLRLKSVLFEVSRSIELCYDDGMLFGGHWVLVPIGEDGTVGEVWEAG
jgi:hypothetical protein